MATLKRLGSSSGASPHGRDIIRYKEAIQHTIETPNGDLPKEAKFSRTVDAIVDEKIAQIKRESVYRVIGRATITLLAETLSNAASGFLAGRLFYGYKDGFRQGVIQGTIMGVTRGVFKAHKIFHVWRLSKESEYGAAQIVREDMLSARDEHWQREAQADPNYPNREREIALDIIWNDVLLAPFYSALFIAAYSISTESVLCAGTIGTISGVLRLLVNRFKNSSQEGEIQGAYREVSAFNSDGSINTSFKTDCVGNQRALVRIQGAPETVANSTLYARGSEIDDALAHARSSRALMDIKSPDGSTVIDVNQVKQLGSDHLLPASFDADE